MLYKIFVNEIRKEVLVAWGYRSQWLGELCSLLLVFSFLAALSQEKAVSAGYCLWFYSILVIGDVARKIAIDKGNGLFAQLYFSVSPIWFLVFSKIVVAMFRSLLLMTALAGCLAALGQISWSVTDAGHLFGVAILILPGLMGMSLVLSALTLLIDDIGWMINILSNALLFLSGVFLPIQSLPVYLRYAAQASILTQATHVIHREDGHMLFLLVLDLLYFVGGWVVFYFFEKKVSASAVSISR